MPNLSIIAPFALAIAIIAQNSTARNTPAAPLPIIEINTLNGTEIESKTVYTYMSFKLVFPNDSTNNIAGNMDMRDKIRGRGNDTWRNQWAKKKSYRLKFDKKTSFFGLKAAKNWILLAQYRDPTLLYNAVAFELGDRFAVPYNHSANFVSVYINGEYKGMYLLTEPNQVRKVRVNIDKLRGWFVEIDEYYDKEPKFRTANYNLPIMVKSPKYNHATGADSSAYIFVKNDINALTDALSSRNFPESGYRNLIDMESVAAYLMINEITANTDLSHPRSVFLYKDKGGVICMGPLWDFDSGYGWNYNNWLTHGINDHFGYPNKRPLKHDFFKRFYEDPIFLAKYKEMWNEKYNDIASISEYMDETADRLEFSANMNFQTRWYKTYAPFTDTRAPQPNDFLSSVFQLKNWYNARVYYLNALFNAIDVLPKSQSFAMFIDGAVKPAARAQRFSLVSYGEMSDLSARLQKGDSSAFQITGGFSVTQTGKGGYVAAIDVCPIYAPTTQQHAVYIDTLILSGVNKGEIFTLAVPLDFTVTADTSSIKKPVAPKNRRAAAANKKSIFKFWVR